MLQYLVRTEGRVFQIFGGTAWVSQDSISQFHKQILITKSTKPPGCFRVLVLIICSLLYSGILWARWKHWLVLNSLWNKFKEAPAQDPNPYCFFRSPKDDSDHLWWPIFPVPRDMGRLETKRVKGDKAYNFNSSGLWLMGMILVLTLNNLGDIRSLEHWKKDLVITLLIKQKIKIKWIKFILIMSSTL